jgi:hypothetical protein
VRMQENGTLIHFVEIQISVSTTDISMGFIKKLKTEPPYHSILQLLCMHPKHQGQLTVQLPINSFLSQHYS